MPWCAKAAILAWALGCVLGVPRFQNYAMGRLFHAMSRKPNICVLHPSLFCHVRTNIGSPDHKLHKFFEDIVIRNWGDPAVVDHNDDDWEDIFVENRQLFREFRKACATSLEDRRKIPMELKNYPIDEE
ncbi:hypothetical protein BCR34DRAFT_633702 [Clohesyomyces aquaticus]|uniref:Uncharacterized protein n=1 Tax=Clohesyomyces aquaticus TaxID=1231657 RepID=A0A1Y1Z3X7_9PLEO|nr:hypothetical protein BCR34DRAFT_633702 [Clohesyomyces aquaticus]